jgi:hypothetical protein
MHACAREDIGSDIYSHAVVITYIYHHNNENYLSNSLNNRGRGEEADTNRYMGRGRPLGCKLSP